jgi:FhuF-like iron-sulfur protein
VWVAGSEWGLADVGRIGAYFVVDVGGAPGWRPVSDLYADVGGVLDSLVTAYADRLRTGERRVAASILFQGYAARLWSPVLGCVALGMPPPDLAARRLRWRYRPGEPVGLNLAPPEPAAEPVPPMIVHEHLAPMVAALHRLTGVARNLLWGNASSALAGTLTALDLAGVRTGAATAVVRGLLESAPLRGTGVLASTGGRPGFRRRSCCLYYRLPGGGLCGDCCLTRVPG